MRTMRGMRLVVGVLLAVGLTASTAGAQCAFQQPRKAKQITLSLIPAFVSCSGSCNFCGTGDPLPIPISNTTTGRGVPGCNPPQTFNEHLGSPANGWLWGAKSEGSVSFKAAKNKIVDPMNPPNTADVDIRIKLNDIRYAGGALVNGTGYLRPVSRGTVATRGSGDMTVIDLAFPTFPVQVASGRANVRITANMGFNAEAASLPGCTAIELLALELADENGNPFARPGLFLSEISSTPPPTPTPISTAPTPTPTPRMRCCDAPSGCVDLITGGGVSASAECSEIYEGTLNPDQNSVCDGMAGSCKPTRIGVTECCQFVLSGTPRCIEGPAWVAAYCTSQYNGTNFPGQKCLSDGECEP